MLLLLGTMRERDIRFLLLIYSRWMRVSNYIFDDHLPSSMMFEEPGSFYVCTEASPRCFIIQKV